MLWLVHALGDSSAAFEALLGARACSSFELLAPDWPGAGRAPFDPQVCGLDALADWLARTIEGHTPGRPVGLVGHSLGSAVAVRAAARLSRVVGLFSIEGNLTAADGYLSGLAAESAGAEEYRRRLLSRVEALAETATSGAALALRRYRQGVLAAAPEALWRIGRSAAVEGRQDGLGEEYRALRVPSVYYWSGETTPPATREYVARHHLRAVAFAGCHWPMIERPAATAAVIAAFFGPLFPSTASRPGGGSSRATDLRRG